MESSLDEGKLHSPGLQTTWFLPKEVCWPVWMTWSASLLVCVFACYDDPLLLSLSVSFSRCVYVWVCVVSVCVCVTSLCFPKANAAAGLLVASGLVAASPPGCQC